MALLESKRFQHGFLLALGAATLAVCFAILRPFFMPLVAAVALAILFYPLHIRIAHRLRRPGLAAGLSVILVIAFILLPAFLLGTAVAREIRQLYDVAVSKTAADGADAFVRPALADPDRATADAAANLAGAYLLPALEDPLLKLGKNGSLNAIRALQAMTGNRASTLLLSLADQSDAPDLRTEILATIAAADPAGAVPPVLKWLPNAPA